MMKHQYKDIPRRLSCFMVCLLMFAQATHAQDECGSFTVLSTQDSYCTGDQLMLEFTTEGVDEVPIFFVSGEVVGGWAGYYGPGYYAYDEIFIDPPAYLCANGTYSVYIELLCSYYDGPYYGEFENVDIEVYSGISQDMFYYDAFSCQLMINDFCGYTYEVNVDGVEIPFNGAGYDLSDYLFPSVDISMFNPFAPEDCSNTSLTYIATEGCASAPCDNYEHADNLNETEICSGGMLALDFTGDVSLIEFVDLNWTNGPDFLFTDPLGFTGNTHFWEVSDFGGTCTTGSHEVTLEVFCANGYSEITVFEFDYYQIINQENIFNILQVDQFGCQVNIFSLCDNFTFEYETDGVVIQESQSLIAFDSNEEPLVIDFTFTNIQTPDSLPCSSDEVSIELDCVDCSYTIDVDQTSICQGDTLQIVVNGGPDADDFFFGVSTPDGQFFPPNGDFPLIIDWKVGNLSDCPETQTITANSNCWFETVDFQYYPAENLTLTIDDIQSYNDCFVCIGLDCGNFSNIDYEWKVNGVIDPEINECLFVNEESQNLNNIEVRVVNLLSSECGESEFFEFELPCTGCSAIDVILPESDGHCVGGTVHHEVSTSSEHSFGWFLDGQLVSTDGVLSESFEITDCVEQHELRCIAYCALNNFVVFDQTIDYTFYNDLGVTIVSEDCYVELVPNCPDVSIFWSEGFQSEDGNVFIPEESQSGEVTFVVVNTEFILDCNQAIYEVEYSCNDVGIETSDNELRLFMEGPVLHLSSAFEIQEVRIANLNGQIVTSACEQSGNEFNCDMSNTPCGIYIVEAIGDAGQILSGKVFLP